MLTLLNRIAADPFSNDINALADLVTCLRPDKPAHTATAATRLHTLIQLLRGNPAHAFALRTYVLHLLSGRRHTTLYTDIGILPSDGFFTELFRRLSYRVLPPAIDDAYLSDCLDQILPIDSDHLWMRAIDPADWLTLFDVIAGSTANTDQRDQTGALQLAWREVLEAIQMLSYRISAMGLEPALVRIHPDLENFESPFVVQNTEVHRYLESTLAFAERSEPSDTTRHDVDHALVMLEQCDAVIARIRKTTLRLGTSVALTYLLVRLTQSIERLRRMLSLIGKNHTEISAESRLQRQQDALQLALDLVQAHNQKYVLRELLADNIHLLARNVTENASVTGEHYIAEDRSEYFGMLRSSAGAGLVVGVMALLKILASYLRAAPLVEAFLFSMNYAVGFMLIHLLHFTVATKQPAMTAARIAASLSSRDNRTLDIDSLAELIVTVLRTQFIAVFGNLITAFPTALTIAWAWLQLSGHHLVSTDKARHILQDIDPLAGPALFYAAIAGVCLFLAGLISGYFDNRAVYTHMAQRVMRLRGWSGLLGTQRHTRFAQYLEKNLGGLMGNFFFGLLLGTIGTFGDLLGLPLDIRHITFSTANLATAWVALDYQMSWQLWATSIFGVLGVGTTNLLVSFGLALIVALRSRRVRFKHGGHLIQSLLMWLYRRPQDFFFAPKTLPTRTP